MKANHLTILEYVDSVCSTLKNEERYSAARLCSSVHNSFARFLEEGKASASVRCLDRALLKDYEQWLYSRNLADNTVSSYLRSLRSSYYRMAGEFHFYASHTLFKNVYTGVSSTCRRSVAKHSVGRVLSGGRLPAYGSPAICFLFSSCFAAWRISTFITFARPTCKAMS